MLTVVRILCFLGLGIALATCKQEADTPQPQPAIFTYKDFQPDTLLRSIDSLVLWGTYYIPSPTTTEDTIRLDVDNDGDNDVALTIGTYYAFESNTYPENNNHVVGRFISLDNSISILRSPTSPYAETANNGQVIEVGSASWVAGGNYMIDPPNFPTISFSGEKYLVFRQIHPTYGSRYGWIHVNKMDDYTVYITEMGLRCNYQLQTIVVGEH